MKYSVKGELIKNIFYIIFKFNDKETLIPTSIEDKDGIKLLSKSINDFIENYKIKDTDFITVDYDKEDNCIIVKLYASPLYLKEFYDFKKFYIDDYIF